MSLSLQSNYAVVVVIWGNEKYVPGCAVLGFSLRRARKIISNYHILCMVGPGISKSSKDFLAKVYDAAPIEIPELKFKTKLMKTERQSELYPWISSGYTRFACLRLTNYSKVLLMDADMIALDDLSPIFEIPAPASDFDNPFGSHRRFEGISTPYTQFVHGQPIDDRKGFLLSKGLEYSTVAQANFLLLEPSTVVYDELIKMVQEDPLGYGNSGCYSGHDEQAITEVYLRLNKQTENQLIKSISVANPNINVAQLRAELAKAPVDQYINLLTTFNVPSRLYVWHNISSAYTLIPQSAGIYPEISRPKNFHWLSGKAWDPSNYNFSDSKIWWQFAWAMYNSIKTWWPGAQPQKVADECMWCFLIGREETAWRTHTVLDCPVISGQIQVENKARPDTWPNTLYQVSPCVDMSKMDVKFFDLIMRTLPYSIGINVLNALLAKISKFDLLMVRPRLGATLVAARTSDSITSKVLPEDDTEQLKICMKSIFGPGYSQGDIGGVVLINNITDNALLVVEQLGVANVIYSKTLATVLVVPLDQKLVVPQEFRMEELLTSSRYRVVIVHRGLDLTPKEHTQILPIAQTPTIVKPEIIHDQKTTSAFNPKTASELKAYLSIILSRNFNLSSQDIEKLLQDKYSSIWQSVFTSKTFDPNNNYEQLETLGDSVYKTNFIAFVTTLKKYDPNQISKFVKEYQSNDRMADFSNGLNLPAYLKYKLPVDRPIPNKWYADIYEAFLGALSSIGTKEGLSQSVTQAIQFHLSNLFKGGLDESYLEVDSDRSFVTAIYSRLGYPHDQKGSKVFLLDNKTAEGVYTTKVVAPTFKNNELLREGLISKPLIREIGTGRAKLKESAVSEAWRKARKYLEDNGLTWARSKEIHAILRPNVESKDLSGKVREHLRAAGYDDFEIYIPDNLITDDSAVGYFDALRVGEQKINDAGLVENPGPTRVRLDMINYVIPARQQKLDIQKSVKNILMTRILAKEL